MVQHLDKLGKPKMNKLYKQILEEYDINRHFYDNLKKEVRKNIDGRVCHDRVVVLNILVKLFNVKSYLEIGVHNGASMSFVVNQNCEKIKCYGIDFFSQKNKHRQYIGDDLNIDKSRENINNNNISGSEITLIAGDSKSNLVWDTVKNLQVDLLFLDGDHSFSGIQSDFYKFSKLVRSGGIIVLDDCEPKYRGIWKLSRNILKSDLFEVLGNFEDTEFIFKLK